MNGHLNVKLFTALSPNSGNGYKATSSAMSNIFLASEPNHPPVPCIKLSPRYIDMIEKGVLIDPFCSRLFPFLRRSRRF